MANMFFEATFFNPGTRDLSKVTDMGKMFIGAPSFNQDLSKWDVSNMNKKVVYCVFDDGEELLMPDYMNGGVSAVSFNDYIRNLKKIREKIEFNIKNHNNGF